MFVTVGSWLLYHAWRAGRLAPAPRAHLGMLLAGWGAFNLGFLAFGAILLAGGLAMTREPASHAEDTASRTPTQAAG